RRPSPPRSPRIGAPAPPSGPASPRPPPVRSYPPSSCPPSSMLPVAFLKARPSRPGLTGQVPGQPARPVRRPPDARLHVPVQVRPGQAVAEAQQQPGGQDSHGDPEEEYHQHQQDQQGHGGHLPAPPPHLQ